MKLINFLEENVDSSTSIVKNPIFWVIIAIVVVAIIAIIFIYIFIIKARNETRTIRELEKKYNNVHQILIDDIDTYLNRLRDIANKNVDYVDVSDEYDNRFQEILQNNDRNSYVALDGLKKKLNDKSNHSKNKNLIDSTKKVIYEFERKTTELYNDLNKLLQKDEEFRQDNIELSRKFRALKEKYETHKTELSLMEDSFTKVFDKIQKIFDECDTLCKSARYDEASEKLPVVRQVVDALEESFDDLPSYCVKVTKIIPNRIEEIKTRYEELQNQDYPLHHLKIIAKIDSYNAQLEEITHNLCSFKFSNVGSSLDKIDDDIMNVFKAFDEEEEAKKYFDQNCDNIYNQTYELEKQFKKIKRALPNYEEVYLIQDKYLEKITELEEDVNNVQTIKRDLDNYIHSAARQPYSLIVRKIYDMSNEMTRINQIINDFNSYLLSLKNDAENDYKMICEYYLKLKDNQALLRDMAVPDYTVRLKVQFDKSFKYLEQIGDIFKRKPIDVTKANEILVSAQETIEILIKDITEQYNQCKYAENSIVYANQYRQGFMECKFSLDSAGQSFFEGDFTRTIDETVSIIKRMRPDQVK